MFARMQEGNRGCSLEIKGEKCEVYLVGMKKTMIFSSKFVKDIEGAGGLRMGGC